MTPTPPVVITGAGVVSPVGHGAPAFWNALVEGRSGVVRSGEPPHLEAPIRNFDPREWINSQSLRRMDHLSQMLLTSSRMALADAELALPCDAAPDRVGIVLGTALGNTSETVEFIHRLAGKGPGLASPFVFPNLVMNAPASYASIEFQARGPNLTVVQGDLSGELAVTVGCDLIAMGTADIVLAGGGDELTALVGEVHRQLGLVASGCVDSWRGPFDETSVHPVLGEGAAVLVLEAAGRARSRGRQPYAEIASHHQWSVPASPHGWPAQPTALAGALRAAVAHLPSAPEAVYCAAAGETARDRNELHALAQTFGNCDRPWITSIKGAIGEFGAAGALTLAAATLSLATGCVAPLSLLRRPLQVDGVRLAAAPQRDVTLTQILVIGLARGGLGTSILLRRPRDAGGT